jgi:hypothetical protein
MPSTVTITPTPDFLRVTLEVPFDFEASKDMFDEVVAAVPGTTFFGLLLDVRGAKLQMALMDVWSLAVQISENRRSLPGKIAVLRAAEHSDVARLFALSATNRGYTVEAFTSEKRAVAWLSPNMQDLVRQARCDTERRDEGVRAWAKQAAVGVRL